MAFRARRGVSDLVSEPAHSPWQGRGMLLLQGDPDPVASWAQRGLMPVYVVPLEGWTAVLPAGPSQASPPYDDTLKTLAGRPVPSRLRSAIGLFVVDGKAMISAHPCGWRAVQRWFVWSPGEGVVQPRQLVAGRPADLVAAAGTRDRTARRRVRDRLVDAAGDAPGLLRELLAVLGSPGSKGPSVTRLGTRLSWRRTRWSPVWWCWTTAVATSARQSACSSASAPASSLSLIHISEPTRLGM